MARKFKFSIGEYYHLYNRGTDKRLIFMDDTDKNHFIKLLFLCNSARNFVSRDIPRGSTYVYERGEPLVEIVAYCLMPNHFHLLVHEKEDHGTSLFMQKLLTAYSMYFNTKQARTGTLFEGKFKAKHADTDEYLKYLLAYIHLNPVKLVEPKWKESGIQDRVIAQEFLNDYKYSSYLDWKGEVRSESKIINREALPEYFAEAKDFDAFMNDWFEFSREE